MTMQGSDLRKGGRGGGGEAYSFVSNHLCEAHRGQASGHPGEADQVQLQYCSPALVAHLQQHPKSITQSVSSLRMPVMLRAAIRRPRFKEVAAPTALRRYLTINRGVSFRLRVARPSFQPTILGL